LVNIDLHIHRAAKLLIDRHGDEAALYTADRADLLLEAGDIEGAAAWRAIVGAIEEVQRERGSDGRAVKKDSLMQPILPSRGESVPGAIRRVAREIREIDAARNIRRRFWVTASSAFVSGILSVITPIWPDWIECIFGADPDGYDGFMEWAIVICLVTIPHRQQS
jgi:hypothetical protein